MSGRTVMCKKLGQELPGMPFKPFPNDFGQLIFESVSLEHIYTCLLARIGKRQGREGRSLQEPFGRSLSCICFAN